MARRTVLFTPGDRPAMLRQAPETGADVLVFDLEDGVAPAAKAEARETVASLLADPTFDPDCEVAVRVNPVGVAADDDLAVVCRDGATLDAVVAPKVEEADDVTTLASLLDERGAPVPVFALVETAPGVLAAAEIAAAEPTAAVLFGAEDLAGDLGATRTRAGTEVLFARQRALVAARAAGVDAIDTLTTAVDDEGAVRDAAREAARWGFDGKLVIHPAQVEPVHEAFAPDPERVAWAERIVAAARDADVEAGGAIRVDGEMVDAPLVRQAERVLDRAAEGSR